jgi:hypothetical protein
MPKLKCHAIIWHSVPKRFCQTDWNDDQQAKQQEIAEEGVQIWKLQHFESRSE